MCNPIESPILLNSGFYFLGAWRPDRFGETIELQSENREGKHIVKIDALKSKLTCGYPTNFSKKDGKNYYHVQHFIALIYLTEIFPSSSQDREVFLRYARKWYDYTKKEPTRNFESLEKVFSGVDKSKYFHQVSLNKIKDILENRGQQ